MKFIIKEIMEAKGFNNVKLAEKLGVTRSTVTNILKSPTLATLEKIAAILDVRVVDLIVEDGHEIEPIYKKDKEGNLILVGYLNQLKK
ncbi:helix-turn-helix domain-containing protein [Chryseobacterium culicis]|uniref:helix-turn-helix domain-containing protein n=1 Tax=Chryseobacterium culicis TaxID=680127 RepID=UPI00187448F0|nr:helix-turn-helix transcriptional regulator [Chryseobacterium culicis]MBE4949908.1 helix-turn-helix transcriptional regulator [Chryseobacterium culicis]